MDEYKDIDWLDRDSNQIEGLDHLGIQAISVAMYSKLLPGITNVTDRARYFSFYPWLLSKFEPTNTNWFNFLRRHEFLLSLASNYAVTLGKAHPTFDRGAVVGSDKAKDAIAEALENGAEKISLDEYTALDSRGKVGAKGTYFKNKEGGYDQYYKRQLDILMLTRATTEAGTPDRDIVKQVGSLVALSVDRQAGFKELNKMIQKEFISLKDLERVVDTVPPWKIAEGGQEEQLLVECFFGLNNEAQHLQNTNELNARRNSLLLILSFLDAGAIAHSIDDFVYEFRWCNMFNCLPNGKPWNIDKNLNVAREMWGIYQLQDVFNFTLENYLWAILEALDDHEVWPNQIEALIKKMVGIVLKKFPTHDAARYLRKPFKAVSVEDYVSNCSRSTQEDKKDPFGTYSDRFIYELLRDSGEIEETLILSTHLLCRLLSRMNSAVYPLFDFDFEFLKRYPLNLDFFRKKVSGLKEQPFEAFLKHFFEDLIVKRHLKVAARKLGQQGQSTFKFIPDAGKLIRIAEKTVEPTLTSPRLKQAIRILCDLHLLIFDERGIRISQAGKKAMRESHALQASS